MIVVMADGAHEDRPFRRICKSAPAGSEFLFEVVGHEGVYFTAPKPSFKENVFSKINENLVGLQWFSTFLESFLETMFVAPFKMLLDTGAQQVANSHPGGLAYQFVGHGQIVAVTGARPPLRSSRPENLLVSRSFSIVTAPLTNT